MKLTVKYKAMAAAVCLLCSCEHFIETDRYGTQITSDEVFSDKKMAEAALAENYIRLRDRVLLSGNNTGVGAVMGFYTDELQNWLVTNTYQQALYTNSLTDSEPALKSMWDASYQIIYQCNKIIEGVTVSTGIAEQEKAAFLAEARFIRILVHFYLSQLWGDVPYVTGTDYTVNKSLSKTTEEAMGSLLIQDAEQVLQLLHQQTPSQNNYRPNAKTVEALLARMHLYRKEWDRALFYADEIIRSGSYVLEEDLSKVFLKESTGTIWQLKTAVEGANALEAQTYVFVTVPPPTCSLTEQVVNSFHAADKRRATWIAKPQAGTQPYFYSNKYRERQNTGVSKEYSVIFRLEELYYIRIEANLRLGNGEQALDDWNLLRTRYGLPVFTALPPNWENVLLQERRHEFFCELGHRFFDLRRTGQLALQMKAAKPHWNLHFERLPLPQSELLLNPQLLPQNEGY